MSQMAEVNDQRRNRVSRRRGIAQIAAQAGASLNLYAADQLRSIDQPGKAAGDLGVVVDAMAWHRGADVQPFAWVIVERADLVDALDIHHQISLQLAFAQRNDQVGAAAQHTRPSMRLGEQGNGMFNAQRLSVIKCMHKFLLE
jgi:hypothetical protein